jgi:hypothetical protein
MIWNNSMGWILCAARFECLNNLFPGSKHVLALIQRALIDVIIVFFVFWIVVCRSYLLQGLLYTYLHWHLRVVWHHWLSVLLLLSIHHHVLATIWWSSIRTVVARRGLLHERLLLHVILLLLVCWRWSCRHLRLMIRLLEHVLRLRLVHILLLSREWRLHLLVRLLEHVLIRNRVHSEIWAYWLKCRYLLH